MGIGICVLCRWGHLIKLQGTTPNSLIHAATEIIKHAKPELYFPGYKYWMISPLKKQELEQLNFEHL